MKTSTVVFGGFFMADNGERIQIPVLENPDIREINHFFSVSNFEKKTGVLVFRIIPEPEFGNTELTVYFEKGYYLPMIQTILEGGDIEVKNLKTENYSGNTMEIWGDSYPIEHISKNISTIQNIISEFMIQKQTPAPII
ncbi:DUF6911 family protein [Neisseria meningitidis]|nr:hypothetical protein [Neisseria meningitidis]AIZ17920.1 hypothetical protein LA50_04590 [Neisseria meningitidis]AIZ19776.1 hypothetical protein LA24_03275 [Neisseria meningitidis M7124]AIZ21653.1 hypothetical protein LA58_02125 [Neisseria meningitidis]AIZ23606.1 hypothetical protein LC14_01475 [Neisseria meningitidis]AIZ26491.1 hypothetical protein LD07_06395 [Neisseria meningitidis]